MIIHPPAIEADSQLQKRLCRWGLRASVVHRVHLEGYFALGLKVLSFGWQAFEIPAHLMERPASEGGPYKPGNNSPAPWKVDAECCSTVFFQDHA